MEFYEIEEGYNGFFYITLDKGKKYLICEYLHFDDWESIISFLREKDVI